MKEYYKEIRLYIEIAKTKKQLVYASNQIYFARIYMKDHRRSFDRNQRIELLDNLQNEIEVKLKKLEK